MRESTPQRRARRAPGAGGPPGAGAPVGPKRIENDWLSLRGSGRSAKVERVDVSRFLRFVTKVQKLKTVVAFDAVGVTGNPAVSGESSLYGPPSRPYMNFTELGWNENAIRGDGSGRDDTSLTFSEYLRTNEGQALSAQLRTTSPIPCLTGRSVGTVAPYWYVRHGMVDRDTSFAAQLVLHAAIRRNAAVKNVSFALPYTWFRTGEITMHPRPSPGLRRS